MNIRRAVWEDYAACARLEKEIFTLHHDHRPDQLRDTEVPLTQERFRELLGDAFVFLVAEEEGRVIAHAFASRRGYKDHPGYRDREWFEIDDIVVDAEHRGKGVGSALFEAMQAEARALGFDHIELTVWGFNTQARDFYVKRGMRSRIDRLEMDL